MSLTPSNMLPLGTVAPSFTLPDVVSGKNLALSDLKGAKATVIMFICNHCPFVKHINSALTKLANDYLAKSVSFIAICSNDIVEYPEDAPEKMKQEALLHGYPFPYLYDASQAVAKAYMAACTPDFYVFDQQLKCIYRGQLDASRPGNNIPVSGEDIRTALDHHLAGLPVLANQRPSQGCNIKWKTQ